MGIQKQEQVKLSQYTTLKVGGEAARLVVVTDVTELPGVLRMAANEPVPPVILGSGSNVLFDDDGYAGVVIVMRNQGVTYEVVADDEVLVTCAAGEPLDTVVAETVSKGLWGIENLSGIPGTVGATPVQNVGAYGVEVGDVLVSLTAINSVTQETRIFSNEACQFGYRTSFFKTEAGKQWVITDVTFRLSKLPKPILSYGTLDTLAARTRLTSQLVRDEVIQIRSDKFPDWTVVGTAGSFFKNPIITNAHYMKLQQAYPELPGFAVAGGVKVPLGYILDKVCGLKGYTKGAVGLYEKQALVLVAQAGATATEIKNFAEAVAVTVKEKTNITIEPEVTFV